MPGLIDLLISDAVLQCPLGGSGDGSVNKTSSVFDGEGFCLCGGFQG